MFGLTRWNAFDDVFDVQRQVDRLFNDFWRDLPTRTSRDWSSSSFNVTATDDAWRIDIPLPGIDPQHVTLEVSGSTLSLRAEDPEAKDGPALRYQQTFTVPQFLDLDRVTASHRHGMLQLTVPLKESVKPKRIAIERGEEQKQIGAAA